MSSETGPKIGDSIPYQVPDNLAYASLSGMFGYSNEFEYHLLIEDLPDDSDDFKITSLLDEPDNENAFLENSDKLLQDLASERICVTVKDLFPEVLRPHNDDSHLEGSKLHTQILIAAEANGGVDSAKPEQIVRMLKIKGLSVERVKSHMETFQHAKYFDPRKNKQYMIMAPRED